jgi:hypothetical protein
MRALPLKNQLLKDVAIFNPCKRGTFECLELNRVVLALGGHAPQDKTKALDEWKLYQIEEDIPTKK